MDWAGPGSPHRLYLTLQVSPGALRGEGSCGGGGAPRDSAGSGATEEGLTSRGGCIYCLGLSSKVTGLSNILNISNLVSEFKPKCQEITGSTLLLT